MLGEYEMELVAIVFGSITGTILLLLGCNSRRLKISRSAFLCVIIGSLDFASDVLFARHALLSSPESVPPTLRYLPIVFVAAPFVLSTAPLLMIVTQSRELIDMDTLARYPGFYSCMLVLALTNLEVLKLMPWRDGKYDGFPTSRLLALTFFTTFAEDAPQTVLQVSFLLATGSSDAIAIISLMFSLGSIWVRGFRKLIIVLFVRPEYHSGGGGAGTLSSRGSSFMRGGASWRRRSSACPPAPGMTGRSSDLSPGSGTRLTDRSLSMPIGSARDAIPRLRRSTDAVASPAVPTFATPTSTCAARKGGAAAPAPPGVYGWCARRLGRFSWAGRRAQPQPIKATPFGGSPAASPRGPSRRPSVGSGAPCLSPRLSPRLSRDSFVSVVSSRRRSLSRAFDQEEDVASWAEQPPITIASPRASSARRPSLEGLCARVSTGDGTPSVAAVSRTLDDVTLRLGEAQFARLEAQLDPTMRAELRRRDSASSFFAASVAATAVATAAEAKCAPSASQARGASFGLRRGGSVSLQKRTAQRRRGSSVGSALVLPTAASAAAAPAPAPAGDSGKEYADRLRADPRIMPLADLRRSSSGGGSARWSSSLNKRSGSRCGSGSDVLSELSSLLSDDDDDDAEREAAERSAIAAAVAAAASRPPIDLGDVDATLRGGAAALQRARAARAARSQPQPHAAPEVAPPGALGWRDNDDEDDGIMQT